MKYIVATGFVQLALKFIMVELSHYCWWRCRV